MLCLQVDSVAADKEGLVAGVDTDQAAGEAAGDESQYRGHRHPQAGQGVSQVCVDSDTSLLCPLPIIDTGQRMCAGQTMSS